MLKVFYGDDVTAVRTEALGYVSTYTQEGFSSVHIDADNFTPGAVRNSLEAVSLFSESVVFILDTPSDNQEMYEEISEHLTELANSVHPFVLIENKLKAPEVKKLSQAADCIKVGSAATKEVFNIFSLTELLLRKDKKNLWVQLHSAWGAGVSSEEVIGILWWQLKILKLVQITNSPVEAGVKPFPYNKSKSALQKFTESEVDNLLHSLLVVYHDGHGGVVDIKLALEQWVLKL